MVSVIGAHWLPSFSNFKKITSATLSLFSIMGTLGVILPSFPLFDFSEAKVSFLSQRFIHFDGRNFRALNDLLVHFCTDA